VYDPKTHRPIGAGILPDRLDAPIALIIAVAFVIYATATFWNTWAIDFSALFMAGHFYGLGQIDQIYAAPPEVISPVMPDTWKAAIADLGHPGAQTYAFIYPPWVAALMSPVTVLDPQIAMNLNTGLNAILLMIAAWLGHRIMGRPTTLWLWFAISGAIAATGLAAQSALSLGQTQILVATLCLLAFERQRAGAPITAGGALALAAALKLTPAAFVLVFFAARDMRAVSAFAIIGAALAGLSLALFGWGPHGVYLERLGTINDQLVIAFIAFSVENWLFEAVTAIQGTAPLHTEIEYHFAKPLWVSLIAKAGLIGSLILLWTRTRHHLPRFTLGIALAIPLFGPLGWAHYYLVALALLPGLLTLASARTSTFALGLVAILLSTQIQLALVEPARTFFPQIAIAVPLFLGLLIVTLFARPAPAAEANQPVVAE